jgi:hypothetical protein
MSNRENVLSDLEGLKRALDAMAADVDATERLLHLSLRDAAESSGRRSHGIEGFVDHFAIVVERSRPDAKL